jgi:hypothetical protein
MDLDLDIRGTDEEASKEKRVKGSEFKAFSFKVDFEATDPAENDRRMLAGLAVKRAFPDDPIMSNRTFRRKYMPGVFESEDEEISQILAEKIVAQIIQSGVMMETVLEELQVAKDEEGVGAMEGQVPMRPGPAGAAGLINPSQVAETVAGIAPLEARETSDVGMTSGLEV